MPDRERLDRRLRAVERTLTGDDHDLDALQQRGDLARRVEELEEQLDSAQRRIDELEAATQALRGYVGNVRSVNEDVEQRADAAVAAVDRLEARLADGTDDRRPDSTPQSADRADAAPERHRREPVSTETASGTRRPVHSSRSDRSDQPVSGPTGDGRSAVGPIDGATGADGTDSVDGSDSGDESGVLARLRSRL
ncbi:hypothetical protein ACAH01_05350 [Halomicrobium sp. HM KBTZ05]|uniref:DUF7310 family coiled-coil domain-containing protein n=1 Tax=Halomicrobium sp. HM KBTZ05 TaxID=3242663 RepID=UPI003558CB40